MYKTSTALLGGGSGIGLAERTLHKVRWRILPLMMVLYVICYIDRTNVGFAKAGLARDVGIGDAAYGLAAGIFFLGYVLFEVPSSAGMLRFGARKWLPLIVISWGVFATAMFLITDATSFNVLRFLLGVAEAGFFPAVLFYFTLWFPVAQRLVVLGIFTVASPVANALGAVISGLILNLDGAWGLHGWQWLFIVEGVPAIVLGIVAGFLLTNRPAHATWLRPEERAWLVQTMDAEHAEKSSQSKHPFLAGLKNRNAWIYGAILGGLGAGVYGLLLWLPVIVNALGHFSHTELGLLVTIPHLVSVPCVYFWAKRAERTGRPAWHSSVSLAVAAVGLLGAGLAARGEPSLRTRVAVCGRGRVVCDDCSALFHARRAPRRRCCRRESYRGHLAGQCRWLHRPLRRRPDQGGDRQHRGRPVLPCRLRGGDQCLHLSLCPQPTGGRRWRRVRVGSIS